MNTTANRLLPGDIVTGVWSDARHRWDPDVFTVFGVDIDTFDGVRLVTIHTGTQSWQRATYCADTIIRTTERT